MTTAHIRVILVVGLPPGTPKEEEPTSTALGACTASLASLSPRQPLTIASAKNMNVATPYVVAMMDISVMRTCPRFCVPKQHPTDVEETARRKSRLRPVATSNMTEVNTTRPIEEISPFNMPAPTQSCNTRPRSAVPTEVAPRRTIVGQASTYAAVDEIVNTDEDPASCSPATLALEGKD